MQGETQAAATPKPSSSNTSTATDASAISKSTEEQPAATAQGATREASAGGREGAAVLTLQRA